MNNTVVALPGARQAPPTGMATSQATAIEQSRAVAEVQAAVVVAQSNPRDIDRALADMRDTCGRMPVANRAFYAVPNRGEGLSVHLMRELARIWGNVDYGVRELRRDDDEGVSEMQSWAWDQQTNTRSTRSFIQPHAKSTRKGRVALTDINDVYLNNQNTGARAVRECIASVIPDWVIAEAEQICRKTLEHGEGKSPEVRSREAVEVFAARGVTRAQLEDYVGAKFGKWTPAMLADLQRVFVSITQDGIAASEFFTAAPVHVQPEQQGNPQTPQGAAPSGTTQGVGAPGADEVEGEDVAASDAPRPADTTPPACTAQQVATINAALNARGVGVKGTSAERGAPKLAWLTKATGRPIASSKDLTREEASGLIEHFAEEDAAKPNALPTEPEPFPNDDAPAS